VVEESVSVGSVRDSNRNWFYHPPSDSSDVRGASVCANRSRWITHHAGGCRHAYRSRTHGDSGFQYLVTTGWRYIKVLTSITEPIFVLCISRYYGACPKNETSRFFFSSRPTGLLQRSDDVMRPTRTLCVARTAPDTVSRGGTSSRVMGGSIIHCSFDR